MTQCVPDATTPHPLDCDPPRWITYLQAAQLIGCDPATVSNMIRDGRLTSRQSARRNPSVDRDSAMAVAETWQRRNPKQRLRQTSTEHGQPPDNDHDWIDAREAAAALGITTSAIHARCRQGRLSSLVHGGRRWLRRSDVDVAATAKAFKAHARKAGKVRPRE